MCFIGLGEYPSVYKGGTWFQATRRHAPVQLLLPLSLVAHNPPQPQLGSKGEPREISPPLTQDPTIQPLQFLLSQAQTQGAAELMTPGCLLCGIPVQFWQTCVCPLCAFYALYIIHMACMHKNVPSKLIHSPLDFQSKKTAGTEQ